jgi:hypothetical protein
MLNCISFCKPAPSSVEGFKFLILNTTISKFGKSDYAFHLLQHLTRCHSRSPTINCYSSS